MATYEVRYEGALNCSITHGESGARITTETPEDGAEATGFTPTDLLPSALGACVMTVLAVWGRRAGVDVTGTSVHVEKHMVTSPTRRVGRLPVVITLTGEFDEKTRKRMARVVHTCPIHQSLHAEIDSPISFVFPDMPE